MLKKNKLLDNLQSYNEAPQIIKKENIQNKFWVRIARPNKYWPKFSRPKDARPKVKKTNKKKTWSF